MRATRSLPGEGARVLRDVVILASLARCSRECQLRADGEPDAGDGSVSVGSSAPLNPSSMNRRVAALRRNPDPVIEAHVRHAHQLHVVLERDGIRDPFADDAVAVHGHTGPAVSRCHGGLLLGSAERSVRGPRQFPIVARCASTSSQTRSGPAGNTDSTYTHTRCSPAARPPASRLIALRLPPVCRS